MSMNDYTFCNLNQNELDKIMNLEKELNNEQDNEIILLAFNKKD